MSLPLFLLGLLLSCFQGVCALGLFGWTAPLSVRKARAALALVCRKTRMHRVELTCRLTGLTVRNMGPSMAGRRQDGSLGLVVSGQLTVPCPDGQSWGVDSFLWLKCTS